MRADTQSSRGDGAIPAAERKILRDLARRVAEIAALPVMAERRSLWKAHNSLHPVRPMILIFPEGAWRELLPEDHLKCRDVRARGIERDLRGRIYAYEHFDSDNIVEAVLNVHKVIRSSGWGIEPKWRRSDDPTGAKAFDPVIFEPADLKKIKAPEISCDEQETQSRLAFFQELLGDILDVRLRSITHLSFHLMSQYTALRGLAEVMMDMVADPAMLHEAMGILERGHQHLVQQYIDQDLLALNNDGTYHSSGGVGYTDELPAEGFDGVHVRPRDMWASAEAQELAQVSPKMHNEFSLQYEKRLLEPFGLNGYGCCEDLTRKLDDVLTIPGLRRISISPWADVDVCAEKLGDRYIFSWKPQPADLCGKFDRERIRAYIQHTLDVTRDCVLEIILKDTHTCDNHPERFDRWSRIARELVTDRAGK